jgi:hypothetical protein
LAPDLLTPQTSSAAWATPATTTPTEPHLAASTAVVCGRMKARVAMFSRIGAPADRMKRSRAFSTPDRCATMAMHGR